MAHSFSTGLRNSLLTGDCVSGLLSGGSIKIYDGTVPADADAAVSGTMLVEVTVPTTGLLFNDAGVADGVLAKDPSQTWEGVIAASGTATYFRWVMAGDDGTASTTQIRVQGTVGVVGADLNLTTTSLVAGNTQAINYFYVGIPQ